MGTGFRLAWQRVPEGLETRLHRGVKAQHRELFT